jgi:hypothetical protein
MTTTGELDAIIEELELVDIGDAASYLGEEATVEDEFFASEQSALTFANSMGSTVKEDYSLYQVHCC